MYDAGIIHAIEDSVLVPPDLKCAQPTFCDYLQGDGNFTFLFEALNETDLCDALDSLDKGTLFAPNDDAFGALPPDVAKCLTNETNADALKDILLYHAVETKNELNSNALTGIANVGATVPTLLDGETISVNSTDGKLILNDNSTVIEKFDVPIVNGEHSYLFLTCFISALCQASFLTYNVTIFLLQCTGILHTIDNVLVPEGMDFDKICNGTKSSKSAKSSSSKSSSNSKAGKRDEMANAMALPPRGGGRISRDSREEEDEITDLNEEEGLSLSMLFGRRNLN